MVDLVPPLSELGGVPSRQRQVLCPQLVASMNAKLHQLIRAEIGPDPNLVERPLVTFATAGVTQRGG